MLYCLIVLYNIKYDQSPAVVSLLQAKTDPFHIVLLDNSDRREIAAWNARAGEKTAFDYIRMNGNCGLPAAYNRGVKFAMDRGADWLLISDQDSVYDRSYFQHFTAGHEQFPQKWFFMPKVVVKETGKVMSPIKRRKQYYINSGMLIHARVFERVHYDEHLFLDFVDYDFLNSCFEAGLEQKIQYLPEMRIEQSFSGAGRRNYEADYNRFLIFVRDGKYYNSKWHGRKYSPELWIRALHLCLLYHRMDFLRVMLRNHE